jgi:hypothetical protein|tara:strand:+ start:3264 stop:3677 length:414 start_codon:yes stop_codon:yes gene_type:complete
MTKTKAKTVGQNFVQEVFKYALPDANVDHETGAIGLSEAIRRLQELDLLLKEKVGVTNSTTLQSRVDGVLNGLTSELETVKDNLFARSVAEEADEGREAEALNFLKEVGALNGVQTRLLNTLRVSVEGIRIRRVIEN